MPSERFYLGDDYVLGEALSLEEREHHHLSHVMRLRAGEEVELVNGRGSLATARIEEIGKKQTVLKILSLITAPPSSLRLIAAVPLMRPSKLEWVIEKGTELGADAFLLHCADLSDKESLSENQLERLRHLTIAALKQSGRLYLPTIQILPDVAAVLRREARFFFGDTRLKTTSTLLNLEGVVVILTGPEKGFSKKELELLDKKGKGIRLSPYILRAETAPIAALSILNRHLA